MNDIIKKLERLALKSEASRAKSDDWPEINQHIWRLFKENPEREVRVADVLQVAGGEQHLVQDVLGVLNTLWAVDRLLNIHYAVDYKGDITLCGPDKIGEAVDKLKVDGLSDLECLNYINPYWTVSFERAETCHTN